MSSQLWCTPAVRRAVMSAAWRWRRANLLGRVGLDQYLKLAWKTAAARYNPPMPPPVPAGLASKSPLSLAARAIYEAKAGLRSEDYAHARFGR
jgi:hypothetical protein